MSRFNGMQQQKSADTSIPAFKLQELRQNPEFNETWAQVCDAARSDFTSQYRTFFAGTPLDQVTPNDAVRVLQARNIVHAEERDAMDHSWYKGRPAGKGSKRSTTSKL